MGPKVLMGPKGKLGDLVDWWKRQIVSDMSYGMLKERWMLKERFEPRPELVGLAVEPGCERFAEVMAREIESARANAQPIRERGEGTMGFDEKRALERLGALEGYADRISHSRNAGVGDVAYFAACACREIIANREYHRSGYFKQTAYDLSLRGFDTGCVDTSKSHCADSLKSSILNAADDMNELLKKLQNGSRSNSERHAVDMVSLIFRNSFRDIASGDDYSFGQWLDKMADMIRTEHPESTGCPSGDRKIAEAVRTLPLPGSLDLAPGDAEAVRIERPKPRNNRRMTIVWWSDGDKTSCRPCEGEPFDPTLGLAICLLKHVMGNDRMRRAVRDARAALDALGMSRLLSEGEAYKASVYMAGEGSRGRARFLRELKQLVDFEVEEIAERDPDLERLLKLLPKWRERAGCEWQERHCREAYLAARREALDKGASEYEAHKAAEEAEDDVMFDMPPGWPRDNICGAVTDKERDSLMALARGGARAWVDSLAGELS